MTTKQDLLKYISIVLDDSLNIQPIENLSKNARLVCFQCGFEPMCVAVQSYLPDVVLTENEAEEIAIDYLTEKKWFSDNSDNSADYIF